MARKRFDPTEAANSHILEQRHQRILESAPAPRELPDLGLDIPEKQFGSAAELLADEFDRKTFGDPIPTYTRVIYGPDPLLTASPELKERLEKMGLEDFAEATANAIHKVREKAVPPGMMRVSLAKAIGHFGVESVAEAFKQRILKIPVRTVEIEAEREDPMFGKPLEEAVARYGTPGMAPKFLSELVIKVNGMRGYRIVKDENGDPVRVGTLIMGEIPERMAERRRQRAADESREKIQEAEESFRDEIERVASVGRAGSGFRALSRDEVVSANATETEDYSGQQRVAGFTVEEPSLAR